MKKTISNILVIFIQLSIVIAFIIIVYNDDMCLNEQVLKNNNLNKIANSVSILFKDEIKEEYNVNLDNDYLNELPAMNIVNVDQIYDNSNDDNNINDNISNSEPLVSLDSSKYTSNESMGFVVSENNKEYLLDENELDVVVAVVASEFDRNLNDALGVMSVILNRCDSEKWSRWAGESPYTQVIRKGQFEVYSSGAYLNFMPNGNNFGSEKYYIAKQAVLDGLNGIRNNDYLGFRAWWVSTYSDKYVVHGGNRYGYN